MERKLERKLDLRSIRRSPTRMLLAGYLTVILIGTVLLMLPVSSREGIVTPVTDSFFTAVSAACVTGLVRFDTYTHWSLFGQIVLLLLIQVGGLGFMTILLSAHTFSGQKIGLSSRILMREAVAAPGRRHRPYDQVHPEGDASDRGPGGGGPGSLFLPPAGAF